MPFVFLAAAVLIGLAIVLLVLDYRRRHPVRRHLSLPWRRLPSLRRQSRCYTAPTIRRRLQVRTCRRRRSRLPLSLKLRSPPRQQRWTPMRQILQLPKLRRPSRRQKGTERAGPRRPEAETPEPAPVAAPPELARNGTCASRRLRQQCARIGPASSGWPQNAAVTQALGCQH